MSRILYMYFPKYRHLEEVSLSLDTIHIYSYHPEIKTLSIEVNKAGVIPELMNSHFGIVALVGKNGAGKTTMMEVLMRYIGDGNSEYLNGSVFLIEEGDEIVCYSDSRILVENENLSFEGIPKKLRYEKVGDSESWRRHVVYLSNHLDITRLNIHDTLFDTLGSNLILTPLSELLEVRARIEVAINDAERITTPLINALWNYQRVEFNRMIGWLGDKDLADKLASIGFKVPSRISYRNNYYSRDDASLNRIKDLTGLAYLPRMVNGQTPVADVVRGVLISFLLYLDDQRKIVLNLQKQHEQEFEWYRSALVSLIERNELGLVGYDAYREMLTGLIGQRNLSIIRPNIHALRDFVLMMESLDKSNSIMTPTDSQSIQVSITTDKGQSIALELKENFARVFPNAEVVTAKFIHVGELDHQLSSGEMSLLALVGKIREALVKLNDDVVFLLDEFELTFHPRWQQMIIDVISSVFEWDPFKAKRCVQVVIATHSPLILSDFPGESVYRLTEKGLEQQVGKRTFAMPLYDLFHDEFFLDESFIGGLARHHILAMGKELSLYSVNDSRLQDGEVKISKEKYYSLKRRIELIGDDFVRNSLHERLQEGLHEGLKLEIRMEELALEMERLKNKKKL